VDSVKGNAREIQINSRLSVLAVGLLVGFLALGLFSQAVHNNSHNEQMYVAAGYLVTHGERLYEDFAFVQTPYAPLVYSLFFRLIGSYFLLTAKLVNFAFILAADILIYVTARRETDERVFSLTISALFLANYYLLRTAIEASNYTIPIACSLGAYYLFIRYMANPRRALAFFFSGLLLAVAIGAKLYYATLVIPFGVASLLYPSIASLRSRFLGGAVPMAAGAIIGAAPLVYYAVRDWDRFAFNNLGYHLLNAQWRTENGFTATMTWASKLDTARDLLANPSYLLIISWLALAITVLMTQNHSMRQFTWLSPSVALSGMLTVFALATAFTPRPLFPQYFAMPVPFFLVLMAALYAQMTQPLRSALLQAAVIATVLVTITVLPRHTGSLKRALQPGDRWAGTESVTASQVIANEIEASATKIDESTKVATLSPVYAIETGQPIYRELATGSFVYRIGDLLSDEERAKYHATSVSTIDQLLDADPPAAILIGDEGELEIPLINYAQSRGYTAVEEKVTDRQLYVR
jgi:hypothetical protein